MDSYSAWESLKRLPRGFEPANKRLTSLFKSYTPGPCLSRHAKQCGGTVGVQHRWAETPPDWTNGHDGVCCRASSTYPGRRSPSALVGHPPRDQAHPNNHQAWASCGRRSPPAVQRPLRLVQLRVVERYKSRAGQPRSSGHPPHPLPSGRVDFVLPPELVS